MAPRASGSRLATTEQLDFSAGNQPALARHLISSRGAHKIRNGLLSDDGLIYGRGGVKAISDAPLDATGRFVWNGVLTPGECTVVGSRDSWGVRDEHQILDVGDGGVHVPTPARAIQGLLFLPDGKIYGGSKKTATYSTGTVSADNGSKTVHGYGTAFLANVDIGMLFRTGNLERVYVVASVDSDTELTLREPYEGLSEDGKTYTLKAIEEATEPYKSGELMAVVGNRLLIVVGDDTIVFSERDKPHSLLPTDRHRLEEGVRIKAIEAVGQNALVFTNGGLYVIRNMALDLEDAFGNTQQQVDRIAGDLHGWGGGGIAQWRGGVVVAAIDGIYLVDASSAPSPISEGSSTYIAELARAGYVPGLATVFRGHFVLPILTGGGRWVNTLVWRLDRPARQRGGPTIYPWSQMDGAGAACTAFASSVGNPSRLIGSANDDGHLLDCTSWFNPDAEVSLDYEDSIPEWELITRDLPLGPLALGRLRWVELLYDLFPAAHGEDPRIRCYVASERETANPKWNQVEWNQFQWGTPRAEFEELDQGDGAASVGRDDAHVFPASRRARYVRLRFVCSDRRAKLILRGFSIRFAPANPRHSRAKAAS